MRASTVFYYILHKTQQLILTSYFLVQTFSLFPYKPKKPSHHYRPNPPNYRPKKTLRAHEQLKNTFHLCEALAKAQLDIVKWQFGYSALLSCNFPLGLSKSHLAQEATLALFSRPKYSTVLPSKLPTSFHSILMKISRFTYFICFQIWFSCLQSSFPYQLYFSKVHNPNSALTAVTPVSQYVLFRQMRVYCFHAANSWKMILSASWEYRKLCWYYAQANRAYFLAARVQCCPNCS